MEYNWVKSLFVIKCVLSKLVAILRRPWLELKIPPPVPFGSCFLPPSVGVPASLFYFLCKMLCNIAKFSFFSPDSRHFGNHAIHPLSSLPPVPLPPPILPGSRPLTATQSTIIFHYIHLIALSLLQNYSLCGKLKHIGKSYLRAICQSITKRFTKINSLLPVVGNE